MEVDEWPDWAVPLVFHPSSIMVPSKTFVPDPKAARIPICQRCEEKNLLCLDGPGNSCYECNKRSAACRDWDPEGGGRAGSVMDVADEEIGWVDLLLLFLPC